MNITYMIGNGFDLGLGLKTSYKDFLRWFLEENKDQKSVPFGMTRLCEVISKNVDTWSNAEIAFAKLDFTEIVPDSKNVQLDILQLLVKFKRALDIYLETQQRMFQDKARSPNNKLWEIGLQFKDVLVDSLIKGECHLEQNEGQKLVLGNQCDAAVINFNYTSAFYELLDCGQHAAGSGIIWRSLTELNIIKIHHVHGSLNEGNTLFGVSAASQIANNTLRNLAEYSGVLIKSLMDREENGNKYSAAIKDLQISDVIVLFGLSFGESDKFWWRKLIELLLANEKLRIYLFPYEENVTLTENANNRTLLRAKWRSKLIASIRDELSDDIYRKIQAHFHRIIIMPYVQYNGSDAKELKMDPWNLTYFGQKILGEQ